MVELAAVALDVVAAVGAVRVGAAAAAAVEVVGFGVPAEGGQSVMDTGRVGEGAGSNLWRHWDCRSKGLACMQSHSAAAEGEEWHGAVVDRDSSSRDGYDSSMSAGRLPVAEGCRDAERMLLH